MRVLHNPTPDGKNWWAEMSMARGIQPAPMGKIKEDYSVGEDGVIYLDYGLTAFSQPQHKRERLFSDRFWFCLGYAGHNEIGNYLGHVFPGTNINSEQNQIIDHGIERILRHRERILRILSNWRRDGLEVENLGILGGRVWEEGRGKGYLEAVTLLGDLGAEVYGEQPRVIGLPSKGMVYKGPKKEDKHQPPQTVFVGDEGITIHTDGHTLENPIAIRDVALRVEQILL